MNSGKILKSLIIIISSISLCSGFLNKIFPSLINFPNLTSLLSLQIDSLSSLKLWQFITHILIYPADVGINIFYIINLFFCMAILNRIGQIIIDKKGMKNFLLFFFTCGITSGIAAYSTILFFGNPIFYAGPTNALYGLLISAIFLFPKLDLMLLFTSSIKGKILIPSLIGMILISHLSNYAYVQFFATLISSITAYLYILFFWNIKSPYLFMKRFDQFIINLSNIRFNLFFHSKRLEKYINKSKIYDISTGNLLVNKEIFINACLEKISNEGRNSLTLFEKIKLYLYSKKINKQKKKPSKYPEYRDS